MHSEWHKQRLNQAILAKAQILHHEVLPQQSRYHPADPITLTLIFRSIKPLDLQLYRQKINLAHRVSPSIIDRQIVKGGTLSCEIRRVRIEVRERHGLGAEVIRTLTLE